MTVKNKANASPSPEEIQSYLPAYDSLELLATGGMGAVYKARQVSLDRPVAIKVLTHACATSLQFRQIFKCEARVMAKLNHPNLVSIFDYGEANGLLYIVMQYVHGRSLHDAAHGKPVAPLESAALISKLGKALSTAHSSGILHRDLKPANILIDAEINPVVVDFGLAHQSDESTMKGETVFGTPGYTAPEVLAPPYRADQRADVFSLGVLLHELLTGQMPQSPYLPPSSLASVDPRYDSVVMRAIHPETARRYPTAEALAVDLDKIIADQELSETPLLLTPACHPELARHPLATAPGVLAAAATVPPVQAPAAAPPENVVALRSRRTSPATKLALAACIAIAVMVTVLVIGAVSKDSRRHSRAETGPTEAAAPTEKKETGSEGGEPATTTAITSGSL